MDRSQMYDFTFIVRRMRVVIEFTSAPWLYRYHGAFLLCFLGVFLMLVAGTLVEYYRDNVFFDFSGKKTVFIVVVSDFAPTFFPMYLL
ncbi:hypothetical protein YA53_05760 [Enterobacter kobei]|nr:hypothetical protein ECNIH4_20125 [Enterobacter cloacae]KJM29461.1 hypothetical protein SS27_19760 [Enterobacter kobei]OWS66807.1 hypothetical protein WM88_10640 [Enterobacter cloacae complex sp. ECNIH6]POV56183.1 hypothetical protein C3379_10265 [Enterobacter cloacae complex sp. ECNIH10]POV82763.1 hypothetical protein C3382_10295 [Enterobacter cloacae complex sp. ECNIH9]